MTHEPMRSLRTRVALAARIVRDRRTLHVPPGHPYSPIPSPADVDRAIARAAAADTARAPALPGIDLREPEQLALLDRLVPLAADLPAWERPGAGRFCYANDWFTGADALFYALVLRHLRPRHVVEVGAGWSSALALDVDERFLGGMTALTFIDPDPARLRSIASSADLDGRLVVRPVQEVPLDVFADLGPGDVLFVDSSHVLKAGSDVQHLIDEVYPRLAAGVHVHIHDVFWPFEYPASWLATGCSVNEAYAIRALLQGSSAFEVVLWDDFLARFHPDRLAVGLPRALSGTFPTGGIWLRRR